MSDVPRSLSPILQHGSPMITHSPARRRSFAGPVLTAASDRRDCLGQVVPYASISLGIILHVGTSYDPSSHWRTDAGELRAAVGFDAGGHSNAHIQGPPAALRELAAVLLDAADQAESAEEPANGAGLVVEKVAG